MNNRNFIHDTLKEVIDYIESDSFVIGDDEIMNENQKQLIKKCGMAIIINSIEKE